MRLWAAMAQFAARTDFGVPSSVRAASVGASMLSTDSPTTLPKQKIFTNRIVVCSIECVKCVIKLE